MFLEYQPSPRFIVGPHSNNRRQRERKESSEKKKDEDAEEDSLIGTRQILVLVVPDDADHDRESVPWSLKLTEVVEEVLDVEVAFDLPEFVVLASHARDPAKRSDVVAVTRLKEVIKEVGRAPRVEVVPADHVRVDVVRDSSFHGRPVCAPDVDMEEVIIPGDRAVL
jgi:hypothetical protein